MDLSTVAAIAFIIFLTLVMLDVPIGFAAGLVGILGLLVLAGPRPAFSSLGTLPYSIVAKNSFITLPLFILMGNIAGASGVTTDLFSMARKWVGWMPGGLAVATVVGGALFSAVSGSSMAATAVLSQACIPEMTKYKYDKALAGATVAAVGTLDCIIPPSTLIVIYGVFTEESIAKLLIAGIVPGLVTAFLYIIQITGRAILNPKLAPAVHGITWTERLISLKDLWPTIVLFGVSMGGIYVGVFTPTEAGGVGAVGAILLALVMRRMNRAKMWEASSLAARTTSAMFIIIVGILIFVAFLGYTRAPYAVAEWVTTLPISPVSVVIVMLVVYLVLGMFMDGVGMMMLTLPVFHPAILALGFDPIWFGILVIKMCAVGMITPPVGFTLFVVKGLNPDISWNQLLRGIIPFVVTEVPVLALYIIFPQIITFLPSTMK